MAIQFARNWWLVALRGTLAVLFGLLALVWPGITLLILVLFFGAYALVDGIGAVVSALFSRGERHWWALLLEGLIGIAAGVLTFVWPGLTGIMLLYLIVAWAFVTGILEIAGAIRLWGTIKGHWLLLISGILSVLFGLIAVFRPGAGALALIWLIGAYAILFGALLIAAGFWLRSWSQTIQS
jgi:uncharacterized membrane protein HdeD (DUF308 family)